MSLSGKYTSIQEVVERIHRDYGFTEVHEDEIAEWIWDIVGLIGASEPYQEKPITLTVEDYRTKLPCDFYSLTSVRDTTYYIELRPTFDRYHLSSDKTAVSDTEFLTEMDPATGEWFYTTISPEIYPEYYTYKLQGEYMFVGFSTGEIELIYDAFPIDPATRLPLIPDDPKYLEAVVTHCASKIAFRLMLKDLLSERKLERIEQLALFAAGAARNKALIPDPHKMESIRNMWKSPHSYYQHFETGDVDRGSRQKD